MIHHWEDVEKPKKSLPIFDGAQLRHRLVLGIEAKCKGRGGWSSLKREGKDALLAEAPKTFSSEERAAIEALEAHDQGRCGNCVAK
jgi:hypothetical protein